MSGIADCLPTEHFTNCALKLPNRLDFDCFKYDQCNLESRFPVSEKLNLNPAAFQNGNKHSIYNLYIYVYEARQKTDF